MGKPLNHLVGQIFKHSHVLTSLTEQCSSSESWSNRGSNFIVILLPPSQLSVQNSDLDANPHILYDKISLKNTSSTTPLTNIVMCAHTGLQGGLAGLQGSAKQNIWTLLDDHTEDGWIHCAASQGPSTTFSPNDLMPNSHLELDKVHSCWISAITTWKDAQSITRTGNLPEANPVQEQELVSVNSIPNLNIPGNSQGQWGLSSDKATKSMLAYL